MDKARYYCPSPLLIVKKHYITNKTENSFKKRGQISSYQLGASGDRLMITFTTVLIIEVANSPPSFMCAAPL